MIKGRICCTALSPGRYAIQAALITWVSLLVDGICGASALGGPTIATLTVCVWCPASLVGAPPESRDIP
eukprot:527738-Pelagomonas_calceolata.AAC.2